MDENPYKSPESNEGNRPSSRKTKRAAGIGGVIGATVVFCFFACCIVPFARSDYAGYVTDLVVCLTLWPSVGAIIGALIGALIGRFARDGQ